MTGLVDLDELALRCRDDQARQYIHEAVACYKAGAFRSCIVATWNAVVFDFLHKLRELDLTGDSRARLKLGEFENIRAGGESRLKEALDFERSVLDVAADNFDLLTPLEKLDLQRLQDDRNRCAHPSMQSSEAPYQPTAELSRTHLRNAVEILLQREPVQGKAAFDQICQEVKSKYFPEDASAAVKHFQGGPLARARKELIRNLVVGITKSNLEDDLPENERRRQLAAIGAIIIMHRAIAEGVLSQDLMRIMGAVSDANMVKVVEYCHRIPEAWDAVGAAIQGKIKKFVESAEGDDLTSSLAHAIQLPEVKAVALKKIESLSYIELATVIGIHPAPELIPYAMTHFSQAGSYRGSEHLARTLILPLASILSPDDLRGILSTVPENGQIWDAGGIPEILGQLFDETEKIRTKSSGHWKMLIVKLGEVSHNMEWWRKTLGEKLIQAGVISEDEFPEGR
ncbi:MAG: hypothetical protein HQL63_14680 [Magnetococcales bacterium]|nr:hypothetical protein [Magnetococcales bacterium]